MRINREIRALKVRLIGRQGEQVGILSIAEAQQIANDEGLDLVEIVPRANPPVCKVIDYGKFRYDQTKREKESKKASSQVKVKEVKFKPNINEHDLQTKLKRGREFLLKGYKLKITCMFRGREMAHPEIGEKLVARVCEDLNDISSQEFPLKRFGRFLNVILAPSGSKKKK